MMTEVWAFHLPPSLNISLAAQLCLLQSACLMTGVTVRSENWQLSCDMKCITITDWHTIVSLIII